ncbi:uracil-DNA glycosylase [Methylomonas sp. MgM2]
MDSATRLQYLEAMGIDVWVSRHQPLNKPPLLSGEALSQNAEMDEDNEVQDRRLVAEVGQPSALNEAGESSAFVPDEIAGSSSPALFDETRSHRDDEGTWSDLRKEVAACRACKLCETRTQTVFGVGNHHADWMLIGEAPGQNEDLQGEPFVGRAGQLLTEMLRAIGLKREQVFIANMLKCRPPSNRDPQAEEVAACNHFLLRQIELVQPKIILAVGRVAAQNLLKTQQPLAKLRGVEHRFGKYPLVVVHHPAYLLRSLTEKAKAWDDLQFAWSLYQSLKQQ